MDVIPAIDLRDGKVVRLLQGRYDRQITYGHDPAEQARQFHADGARWLHVVDLDGAKAGKPVNTAAIAAISRIAPPPSGVIELSNPAEGGWATCWKTTNTLPKGPNFKGNRVTPFACTQDGRALISPVSGSHS